MQNIILAFPNRADVASFSGGSWRAGKLPANLTDRDLSLVARSSDVTPASSQFVAVMDQGRQVRVIALLGRR